MSCIALKKESVTESVEISQVPYAVANCCCVSLLDLKPPLLVQAPAVEPEPQSSLHQMLHLLQCARIYL